MNQPANQNSGSTHASALLANLKSSNSNVVKEARVFRSNVASLRYVFKAGKVAAFLSGKYTTNIAHEIEELDEEIAMNHPNITANKEEVVALSEPMEALRAKFIAEYLETAAKSVVKTNDAGFSEQGKLNVANSTTVSEGMASSDSSGGQTMATAAPAGKVSIAVKS